METAQLALVATILLAAGGWLFTFVHARAQDRRRAHLDLVSQRLRLLYGPLYAHLRAGRAVWDAFYEAHRPAHGQSRYFAEGHSVSAEELARWRHWMIFVFHPMNKRVEAMILTHMDLVEQDDLPDAFTAVLAHIAAYDAVINAWHAGDLSMHTSVLDFPDEELMNAVEPIYLHLREQQRVLTRKLRARA